jgi:hypothetical protein
MKKFPGNSAIFSLLALLMAAGFTLLGCVMGVGNTDPKSLEITNLSGGQVSQGQSGIAIGIFPPGTSPQEAISWTGIVARAFYDDVIRFGETTLTVPLYSTSSAYQDPWIGSGSYDVYLIVGSGDNTGYYRKQYVAFSSALTRVSAKDFMPVSLDDDPGGGDDNPGSGDNNPGSGGNNRDSKTLEITGIGYDQALLGQLGIAIGIFPSGTNLQEAILWTGIVAGASYDDVSLSEEILTVPLYSAPFGSGKRWTGSGSYDIYLMLGSGSNTLYYRRQNVVFSSASTKVSAMGFSQVSPSENAGAKTLVITGISEEQASHGLFGVVIGIFPPGTSPQQANSLTGIVARAVSFDTTLSGNDLTIRLYSTSSGFKERWTGSGTYDIYLTLGYGSIATHYRSQNASFISASTGVSARSFSQL